MLGLDDIDEILSQIDEEADMEGTIEEMEEQAQKVKQGESQATIKDPDQVIDEADERVEDVEQEMN